jgi:DMSO/TMAO reductase YedYZ heme-binding membrane subunit
VVSTTIAEPSAAPASKRRVGRALAVANLVVATGVIGTLLVRAGGDDEATAAAISVAAPVAIAYFVIAFVARPLNDLFDAGWTHWLKANRRYIGLSFAAWHLQHFPILGTLLVILGPHEFWAYFGDVILPAGTILLTITAMAATSTDGAQRWLGMRWWSALHTVGSYAVWAWAFQIYLNRIPDDADRHDYVYLWLLIGALVVRWIAAARRLGLAVGRRFGR